MQDALVTDHEQKLQQITDLQGVIATAETAAIELQVCCTGYMNFQPQLLHCCLGWFAAAQSCSSMANARSSELTHCRESMTVALQRCKQNCLSARQKPKQLKLMLKLPSRKHLLLEF